MPARRNGADILLSVRLSPRASRDGVGGTFIDSAGQRWLQASVTAPPDRGRANAALIALLARALKVPASSIFVETGETNRLKRLRIAAGTAQIEQVLGGLAQEERNES